MNIVCTFLNEPPATLENVPDGVRWIYVCRDPASKGTAKLVTWNTDEVRAWMNHDARVSPWIEPMEVCDGWAGDRDDAQSLAEYSGTGVMDEREAAD